MDPVTLYRRARDTFDARVHAVRDDQWRDPTPAADWDVRALVGHLVTENLWVPPLFEGRTIEQVGDAFEGDVLGDDPVGAWDRAAEPALGAIAAGGALERVVHLSSGDATGADYVRELSADHLIHAWDLARAIGADERLDPDLVASVAAWFEGQEDRYRELGLIGPPVPVPPDADQQTALLARFGREA
jgi:uncharacterized protein (TIGR03086 family)